MSTPAPARAQGLSPLGVDVSRRTARPPQKGDLTPQIGAEVHSLLTAPVDRARGWVESVSTPNETAVARTERLLVRPWRAEEAPRLLDILSRVEVATWLGDGEPVLMKDLDEARRRIDRYRELSAAPPLGFWAVEVVSTGQVVGSVLLLTLPNAEDGEVEIGWHLHPDSWGRGYASEAAAAVLDHGFAGGLTEIMAVTHLDNWPSQGVARKLGMEPLGVMEKWYDGPSQVFRAVRPGVGAGHPPSPPSG